MNTVALSRPPSLNLPKLSTKLSCAPLDFSMKTVCSFFTITSTCPAHLTFSAFHLYNIFRMVQIMNLLALLFSLVTCHFLSQLGTNIPSAASAPSPHSSLCERWVFKLNIIIFLNAVSFTKLSVPQTYTLLVKDEMERIWQQTKQRECSL